jgi:hypothetical protein
VQTVGVATRTEDTLHFLGQETHSPLAKAAEWRTRLAARIRSDIGRGRTVLSKAARPKSVRPASLAGCHPPAAGLSPATAVTSHDLNILNTRGSVWTDRLRAVRDQRQKRLMARRLDIALERDQAHGRSARMKSRSALFSSSPKMPRELALQRPVGGLRMVIRPWVPETPHRRVPRLAAGLACAPEALGSDAVALRLFDRHRLNRTSRCWLRRCVRNVRYR